MISRYSNKEIIVNNLEEYSDLFRSRNVGSIKQFSSYNFNNLRNLDFNNFNRIVHVVQPFEQLFNISQKYYKLPFFGWVILATNNLSSEFEIEDGSYLNIYFPIQKLIGVE